MLKVDGTKVSGTITDDKERPLSGQFKDGKLDFSVTLNPNSSFRVTFKGVLKDDGTLAGTFNGPDDSARNWTAKRVKPT